MPTQRTSSRLGLTLGLVGMLMVAGSQVLGIADGSSEATSWVILAGAVLLAVANAIVLVRTRTPTEDGTSWDR
jgi:hypothetical protein